MLAAMRLRDQKGEIESFERVFRMGAKWFLGIGKALPSAILEKLLGINASKFRKWVI